MTQFHRRGFIISLMTILFGISGAHAGELMIITGYSPTVPCGANDSELIQLAKRNAIEQVRTYSDAVQISKWDTDIYSTEMYGACRRKTGLATASFAFPDDTSPKTVTTRGYSTTAPSEARENAVSRAEFFCNTKSVQSISPWMEKVTPQDGYTYFEAGAHFQCD